MKRAFCEGGIFGKLFGHRYLHIYDEHKGPCADEIDVNTRSSGGFSTVNVLDMLEKTRLVSRVYRHSLCLRCGDISKELP